MAEFTEKEKNAIKETINTYLGNATIYNIKKLEEMGYTKIERLPYSIRVLLENVVRSFNGDDIGSEHVLAVANWPEGAGVKDVPYMPARVVLQDFTGVPLVVDLAAMRDAVKDLGYDPAIINPEIPCDLIIDHSVQVDYYGTSYALHKNMELEFKRNSERYRLLKWAQKAFKHFRVFPPGTGIIHQVNLEYLSKVIQLRELNGELTAFPDSLVGTDSHTVMVNGLSVFGWGVGGIEAEAVMLGLPYWMVLPEVIGVKLVGELPEGATATDLVLTVTNLLRKKGVVGKFVEFFGPGIKKLSVPDRATLSNMAPEYGATMGFFPIDEATINYLKLTGRDPEHVKLVEEYAKKVGIWYDLDAPEPQYTDVLVLDMSTVEPVVAGPSHPEDKISLKELKQRFYELVEEYRRKKGRSGIASTKITFNCDTIDFKDGSTVIAAITSCTNTSNPSVLIGAGLLAKNAVERGLDVKPYVKTSLAPGSRVVVDYLKNLNLIPYLEALKFHVVGFGCTTCIGNSGPLPEKIVKAILDNDIYAAAVLSGNRNFEGRVSPYTRGNFLASPMLVIAFALAGRVDIDFYNEPIGYDPNGQPVYLRDIWPSQEEIRKAIETGIQPEMFIKEYQNVLDGDKHWQELEAPTGTIYHWDPKSTYIRKPPYFDGFKLEIEPPKDIKGARVLVLLEDRVSTDHISPAGAIHPESPAGKYLIEHGVKIEDFNTYGSRRGNHEVMMRGTFANVRVKNQLVPGKEGWWTKYIPTGEITSVYEAAMKYKQEGIPLIILGGKNYGVGSSRDWAAKGPALLGVKAVIAESFERIHRSNLIGMGVLPLEFEPGQGWKQLGLTGEEEYDIIGLSEGLEPRKKLKVIARKKDGTTIEFNVTASLNTKEEVEIYLNGGIMPYIVREMIKHKGKK
ncbi:MAG: aconitate hydratase AcnA [Candidatus Njordarchaeia archaeon]